jgi:2-oxoglutarate ferredoxin oxidoreductase subunit alpha
MRECSVLIGGQAGDGIRQIGGLVARALSSLGYHIYFWDDYPSLIRGGHNFSIIRASEHPIGAHRDRVDILVALNETTLKKHKWRLKQGGVVIYDSDAFEGEGTGMRFTTMVKEAGGRPIMRNAAALGAIARALDVDWRVIERLVRENIGRDPETNLKIARAAYDTEVSVKLHIDKLDRQALPLIQGNEAIALGAARAGLKLYIAYPMTPASSILHYLAAHAEDLGLTAYHPENEIAAVISAIGGAYAGARTMVGSSGGGFALMAEGVSLCGQSETPVVFVVSQRPGPSTGVPTYTMQGDLPFVLGAGHGEFVRLVVAPGDPDQAFLLSGLAMNMAWKYQIPAFIMTDKDLSESTFCFASRGDEVAVEGARSWDGEGDYDRYLDTPDGVSPLAFPGTAGATVKATSYEHDEHGITTEEPERVAAMHEKRLRKRASLVKDVEAMEAVKVYGKEDAEVALLTWGSTRGACVEVAGEMGLKVVQPLVMEPFPARALGEALEGTKKVISVEVNATGLLARLAGCHGFKVDEMVLKYDGRPFTVDELTKRLEEVAR